LSLKSVSLCGAIVARLTPDHNNCQLQCQLQQVQLPRQFCR